MQQEWAIKKKLETHWSDFTEFFFFCWFSIIDIEHVNRKEENRHEERQINQTSFMYGGGGGGGICFSPLHWIFFFSNKIPRETNQTKSRHSPFFFFAINTKKVGKVWDGWRRTKEKQHVSRWTDTIYHIHWPLIRHITRCPTLLFWLQFLTGVRQNNRRLDCFLFPPEPPSRHPRATSHNEMFHPRQKNKNKNKIMKHFCFESLFPRFCCGCCYFRTHRHTCRTIRLLLV